MEIISQTQSLCPICLGIIPASIIEKDNGIYIQKKCANHGESRTLISSSPQWYHRAMEFFHDNEPPINPKNKTDRGCPFDCGYCEKHKQRMFLPVVPITSACNLNCPVCYTINKNQSPFFMTKDEFSAQLEQIRVLDPDLQIINFTGGEPLMHPDFCDLVEMCREQGIHRITVSTNGLRFLEDQQLLPRLTELGARIVFSFNSFKAEPYQIMSGIDLLEKKLKILELLSQYRPSTTLLTVVAASINDTEIGDIVRFVLESEFVVSSEIHTVTFTGQNVGLFDTGTRLTTPDVISDIVSKNKNIKMNDFIPSPCAHPLCYAICYLIQLDNGATIPFTDFVSTANMVQMLSGNLYMEPTLNTEQILTDVMNDLWSREEQTDKDGQILLTLKGLLSRMFPAKPIDFESRQRIAENTMKAIYIHSHMDAENFDLSRIARCCGAVPDGKGGNIPTCAYNIIYRARDSRFMDLKI